MTICQRCHRPLKNPAINGMGPVCSKTVKPVPEVELDLFGYDIEAAATAAQTRLAEFIAGRTAMARHSVRFAFRDARKRLGVLA